MSRTYKIPGYSILTLNMYYYNVAYVSIHGVEFNTSKHSWIVQIFKMVTKTDTICKLQDIDQKWVDDGTNISAQSLVRLRSSWYSFQFLVSVRCNELKY